MRLRDFFGKKPVDVFADFQKDAAQPVPPVREVKPSDAWVLDPLHRMYRNTVTGGSRDMDECDTVGDWSDRPVFYIKDGKSHG